MSIKKEKEKQKEKEKPEKPPRVTVAGVARDLIKAGEPNEAIWAVLKKTFHLNESKKHYPGWYRSELKRKKATHT